MDICTFETAQKLKAAGFPEPEFACWQVWYNESGIGTFLGGKLVIADRMHFSCYSLGSGRKQDLILSHGENVIFAPTDADILKAAKGLYLSPMMHDDWGVFMIGSRKMVGYHHENPAEACAEAYLSLLS